MKRQDTLLTIWLNDQDMPMHTSKINEFDRDPVITTLYTITFIVVML